LIDRVRHAVLVAERGRVPAMELMVQPSDPWGTKRDALELPFRTLDPV
jgi:hypothetical protein